MNYKHTALLVLVVTCVVVISCSAVQTDSEPEPGVPRDLESQVRAADTLLPTIAPPAVVYVGETHTAYADHVNQLAVIRALRERGLKVAVGMEMFQTPFQQPLDEYIEGNLSLERMLADTKYFERWRLDPRMYAPIFEYARQHRLPLVALNASKELTARVGEVGIDGLSPVERSQLPDTLIPPAPAYRAQLERAFEEHDHEGKLDLERFVDVQATWDEVMAKTTTAFLETHPDHILTVLAGSQHVAGGYGIPARVENATGLKGTIVLSEAHRQHSPKGADLFLERLDVSLPKSGRMGIYIDDTDTGAVIAGFAENSPARDAGAEENDVITQLNGRTVTGFDDIRQTLWRLAPGNAVTLEVKRPGVKPIELSFELY